MAKLWTCDLPYICLAVITMIAPMIMSTRLLVHTSLPTLLPDKVPSLKNAARQINKFKTEQGVDLVFLSTDATPKGERMLYSQWHV